MGRQEGVEAGRKHCRAAHGLFGYKWYHRGRGWESATREEKEGKKPCAHGSHPLISFSKCSHMSPYVTFSIDNSDIQIFFQEIVFISMEIKALNFISFASLSTTPRACWSRRNRRRSPRWDSSPCPSCPGHSVSPCIPGLRGSSSALLSVGIWGSRCSELEVSIGFT